MSDKLNTCMICEEEFKEDEKVVVVYDATYAGFRDSEDIASFDLNREPEESYGCPIERGVYCNNCYNKLMSLLYRALGLPSTLMN